MCGKLNAYQIHGGDLIDRQKFCYAQRPTTDESCALDGQCASTSGHLLVGTEAGLQIFDPLGRLQLILPKPLIDDQRINYCALHQNTLYIATRHRIYKRQIRLTGAPVWQAPARIPKPRP